MTQVTSLTLDNPSFNALKLKVTPLGVEYFMPIAGFTPSIEFLTVTFSDASTAGSSAIVSWSWDFGDDSTSTEQNPVHTYAEEGTYMVGLTIADENGRTDSYTADVMVAPPVAPTAGFSYGVNQLTVSFADGSVAGDGAITGWSWDFGDDSTSTEQNPSHNYTGYDVYSVSLTVTDENDSTDTHIEDVEVLGGLVIGPFTFYPNPSSGAFMGQVTLDGGSATEDDIIAAFDPDGNCAGAGTFTVYEGDAYIYNFSIYGDDETTGDYDEGMGAGDATFTLKLWVSSSGNTINYSESFSDWSNQNGAPMPGYDDPFVVYNFETGAAQPPAADFSGDPRVGDAPLTVEFMDESTSGTDPIATWSWNFGDEGFADVSTEQNPSYTYEASGVYTVMLTVTDASDTLGSSITKENYILVGTTGENDPPLATDINVYTNEDENIIMNELYAENSFDADGDELTFSASGAEHGTHPAGGMTYAPHADYYGFDSFTYTATDPSGLFATANVFVIIVPVDNDPPVAVIDIEGDPEGDGFVETTEDVTLSGWGSYDVDDCPEAPGNTEGCLSFQGTFEWSTIVSPPGFNLQIPGPGYASFDAPEVEQDQNLVFSLMVNDGQFDSDPFIVTIPVQNNNAPVLDSIGIQYTNQDSLSIPLSATGYDDDPLTFDASSSDTNNVTIVVVPSGDNTADLNLSFAGGWVGMAFVTASVCDAYHCDSETFTVWVSEPPLGVDDIIVFPEVFALRQNYPNPFNPVTTIAYDIPEIANVRIDMYNILGQKVRTLVNGTHQPGMYHVRWNGTNDFGNPVSSGMYFYRISSEEFISVKKLVLMK